LVIMRDQTTQALKLEKNDRPDHRRRVFRAVGAVRHRKRSVV